ncbi:MAG: malonyl-CoA decarboxylase [Rhizobiales bacterium]|nr:malonyl-CoA decarboxylase [Hyphomicrobiales bacterium]
MKAFGRDASFVSDLLQSIADRSRQLLRRGDQLGPAQRVSIVALARQLISSRGEASGVALARALLLQWDRMGGAERLEWFRIQAEEFGPELPRLQAAVESWLTSPTPEAAQALHEAAEPLRQEVLRRINLAPGGTAKLVRMREELLSFQRDHPELAAVDADFVHLFTSWFNRGFLVLKRIDWASPADILEKIIQYEAVHEISGWDDLRRRLQPPDRCCFAFFHPQMPEDPLIFVEVALTAGIPREIAPLLAEERKPLPLGDADTAVFYSISNTQAGLKGISFGNFLIKQVVDELTRDTPGLKTFVTLSPLPGFADWLAMQRMEETGFLHAIEGHDRLSILDEPGWAASAEDRTALEPVLEAAAAAYLARAKAPNGRPLNPVARFHLGNGASLHLIHACADLSANGLKQGHGVMVNYLYDLKSIEKNHEAYANQAEVVCSPTVRRLLAPERRTRAHA